ncbi:hypothetical protein NDU88_006211, partial [Pleurodeles waltl]
KDSMSCSSYRPISLLNADYKLYTGILAKRLGGAIGNLIHLDQKGFMKGRQLHEVTHKLFAAIDLAEQE